MSGKVKRSYCMVSVFACLILASAVALQVTEVKGGKPVPPPPSNPPVHYTIHWLDRLGRSDADTWDMNNVGDVVGNVYDYAEDGLHRINQTGFAYLASLDQVFDVNALINDPSFAGWTVIGAYGINEFGQIAGWAVNDDTGESRGFVLDAQGTKCILLPQPVNGSGQFAKKINECGDVVAEEGEWKTQYTWDDASAGYVLVGSWQTGSNVTAFNDYGQILLADGRRYMPGVGWENLSTAYGIVFAMGMNNDGTFVGKRSVVKTYYCFRFTDGTNGTQDEMLDIMNSSRSAWDVNANGDVCITDVRRAYLYTDDDGLWAIDDMVTGAAADVAKWKNATITYVEHIGDPNDTGHGRACGRVVLSTRIGRKTTTWTEPFLLTPVLP